MAITKVQTAVTPPAVSPSAPPQVNTATSPAAPVAPVASAPVGGDTFKSGAPAAAPVASADPGHPVEPAMTRPFAAKPLTAAVSVDYGAATQAGAPKDNATAVSNADLVLRGPDAGDEPSLDVNKYAQRLRMPPAVNGPDDNDPSSGRYQAASAQVKANAPLEQIAVAKLNTMNQGKYQTVKDGLSQDPVAQLALQKLLFQGKLPGGLDVHKTGTLIENLGNLATTSSLTPTIDRRSLLASTVQEVATPSSIHQGGADTCGATSAAIQVAFTNPSEYVRLVSGLAGPMGKVTLTGDDTETSKLGVLRRVAGTEIDDGSGRSPSQRLLAPALMDYADGMGLKYELGHDNGGGGDAHRALNPGERDQRPGLYADQDARLQSAILNRAFQSYPPERGMTADGAVGLQKISALLAQGTCVNATIAVGGNGTETKLHTVCVTGLDPDGPPAGWVQYVNPWGREERMPIPVFQKRMDSLTYPQGLIPETAPQSPPAPATTVNAITRGTVPG